MGYYLIVTQPDQGPPLKVELLRGPIGWGMTQGLEPGRRRGDEATGGTILYVEYSDDGKMSHRRLAWLQTEEGHRALQRALDADARGECACDDLLSGPKEPSL